MANDNMPPYIPRLCRSTLQLTSPTRPTYKPSLGVAAVPPSNHLPLLLPPLVRGYMLALCKVREDGGGWIELPCGFKIRRGTRRRFGMQRERLKIRNGYFL